ncbi:hypothetical protein KAX22_03220 [bacterium]|nr:hypothetical protein [bacterium]
MKRRTLLFYLAFLGFLALSGVLTPHQEALSADLKYDASDQIHVIDVTNLQNTVTNIGSFGSPVKPYPSCEWPAWSTNLYLNEGELWVGGVSAGDTVVTTGRLSGREWSPLQGIEITPEGSAFSDEDTYTRYHDLNGRSGDHLALNVRVSQRTLAWNGADFIVHDMVIQNMGDDHLTGVYVGFCWDFNIARLGGSNCALDDLVGLAETDAISYMFDDDGDGGLSPGYIGGAFLNAPLAGHGWWSRDQEPLDDSDRYALLSGGLMADPTLEGDYRLLQSVGPFELPAGRKIPLLYALAIGDGLDGLQESVEDAVVAVGRDVAASGDGTLYEGETHEITVILGESKRALGRVQLAVDWEFCELGLNLLDPSGNEITPETALGNPLISYVVEPHRKAYELVNPPAGEWTMRVSYISGPGLINYHYKITVFDVPYGFGQPMDYFAVNRAYIRFDGGGRSTRGMGDVASFGGGNFWAMGNMELPAEGSFDPAQDPVIFKMGSYHETIPPGSFVPWGPPEREMYCYRDWEPGAEGILLMLLNLTAGRFRTCARAVDMTGTENPVLVSMSIGPFTGFENILMQDCGNQWYYPAQ